MRRSPQHFKHISRVLTNLQHERVFSVTPTFIERWLYIDGKPHIETFAIESALYSLLEYGANGEHAAY